MVLRLVIEELSLALDSGHNVVIAGDLCVLERQVGVLAQATSIFLHIDVALLAAEIFSSHSNPIQRSIAAMLLLLK